MSLPFTHDAFLDVFAAFNRTWWPVIAALWIATTWAAVAWWRGGAPSPAVFGLLAVHWLWSGVAYHWGTFREINPAATVFGAAFVAQGVAFCAAAGRVPLARRPAGVRRAIGDALLAYGLGYPVLGLVTGLTYPALPLFGVPCPTTLVTAGWLAAATTVPRVLLIVPVAWAIAGSSAAVVLDIRADVALAAAALALLSAFRRQVLVTAP